MNIYVNDELKKVDSGLSLKSLLIDIGMVELSGWAIAMNEQVVPVEEIEGEYLSDGDRLILIQATQGG
jgi:sulfur carrier protein|tara:strand:- start:35 stop:238 length:204 start_codon:yes stop_codon:yes gene_type:complete